MTRPSHFSPRSPFSLFAILPLALLGCGNSDSIGALGHGGSGGTSSATSLGSGGQVGSGGSGTLGSGGAGAGGKAGSGGIVAAGGVPGTGGLVGTGGAAPAGGGGSGGAGGAHTGAGGSATGGQAGQNASDGSLDVASDLPISSDAGPLAALCTSTGGQLDTKQCCNSVGDFPDMCSVGACGCSPSGSHSVTVCTCLNLGCFSPSVGCTLGGVGGSGGTGSGGGSGGSGGAGGSGGSADAGHGGSGGSGGSDANVLDGLISTDAAVLAELCTSTGGQIKSQSCCSNQIDFPNSCLGGACGCAPDYSHTIPICSCPNGYCFLPDTGCGPRGGFDADLGSDAYRCTAQPDLDATYCVGSNPPHYYGCIGTTPPPSCVQVSVGNMTDGFCCP